MQIRTGESLLHLVALGALESKVQGPFIFCFHGKHGTKLSRRDGLEAGADAAARRPGPYKSLAAEVGLTAPACAERVRRLKERGVIKGYRAEVDWTRLGFPINAIIRIAASAERGTSLLKTFRETPNVVEVMRVTGSDSYILHVLTRSSAELRPSSTGSAASARSPRRLCCRFLFRRRSGLVWCLGEVGGEAVQPAICGYCRAAFPGAGCLLWAVWGCSALR